MEKQNKHPDQTPLDQWSKESIKKKLMDVLWISSVIRFRRKRFLKKELISQKITSGMTHTAPINKEREEFLVQDWREWIKKYASYDWLRDTSKLRYVQDFTLWYPKHRPAIIDTAGNLGEKSWIYLKFVVPHFRPIFDQFPELFDYINSLSVKVYRCCFRDKSYRSA